MSSRKPGGFTLVEILIGTVVFSIILSAAFMLIIRWSQITSRNEALTEAQEAGRQAISLVSHDVEQAFYIYTYGWTKIGNTFSLALPGTPGDLGIALNYLTEPGAPTQNNEFFTPMVTLDGPAPNPPTPPINYPPALEGGNGTGWGNLNTDVLTMVATSMVDPVFVCYFRFPGGQDGFADSAHYGSLMNHLIRLTMKCSGEPGAAMGAFYQDSDSWTAPDMTYPGGASLSVDFEGVPENYVSGAASMSCNAADVQVLCPVGNSASATIPVFTIDSLHPYSDTSPVSPYLVNTHLMVGDPANNLLNTGGGTSSLQVTTLTIHDSTTHPPQTSTKLFVPVTLDSYAANVSLPEAQ